MVLPNILPGPQKILQRLDLERKRYPELRRLPSYNNRHNDNVGQTGLERTASIPGISLSQARIIQTRTGGDEWQNTPEVLQAAFEEHMRDLRSRIRQVPATEIACRPHPGVMARFRGRSIHYFIQQPVVCDSQGKIHGTVFVNELFSATAHESEGIFVGKHIVDPKFWIWIQMSVNTLYERKSQVEASNLKTKRNEAVFRSAPSLKSRWGSIHPNISKLCGYYDRIVLRINGALKTYAEVEGSEFAHFRCLKEVLYKSGDNKDEISVCPIGTKKAKEGAARIHEPGLERKKDRAIQEKQIHLNQERLEVMRRHADMEIMSKDLIGMGERERLFFEMLNDEVANR
ncbi:hypothetical protein BDA99DRAFT_534107 [Phascolomyces articulosus]|uniref:Uncharacterized protein n=1 Tax=Phascolomyces articulosus TaxID=60185 RepID=A0AAD5K6D7_9FUNG|nr:hypothetical protein BDA99DRAFT_534107 [Phascolomyces articulosus]